MFHIWIKDPNPELTWYRGLGPWPLAAARHRAVEMIRGRMESSRVVFLAQVRVSVPCPCLRVVLGRLVLGRCHMRLVRFSELCDGLTRGVVLMWSWAQIGYLLFSSLG